MTSSGWRPKLAILAVAVAGCPNDTRDAHCAPDAPSRDLDPACIYAGNGEGPQVAVEPCVVDADAAADCADYPFDVVLTMMRSPSQGRCATADCHGASRQAGIYFDLEDPQQVYDELTSITGSVGSPYVVPGEDGWMYCNLAGTKGGGFSQPPPSGLMTPSDADEVGRWILCGAEGP